MLMSPFSLSKDIHLNHKKRHKKTTFQFWSFEQELHILLNITKVIYSLIELYIFVYIYIYLPIKSVVGLFLSNSTVNY